MGEEQAQSISKLVQITTTTQRKKKPSKLETMYRSRAKAPQYKRYEPPSDDEFDDDEDDFIPEPAPTFHVNTGGNRNGSGTQTNGDAIVGNSYLRGNDNRKIGNYVARGNANVRHLKF